jgi:low affinity Fe/Cu permease
MLVRDLPIHIVAIALASAAISIGVMKLLDYGSDAALVVASGVAIAAFFIAGRILWK